MAKLETEITDEELRRIAHARGYRLINADAIRTAQAQCAFGKDYLFRVDPAEHAELVRRQMAKEIAILISKDIEIETLPGELEIGYRATLMTMGDVASPARDDFYLRYTPRK